MIKTIIALSLFASIAQAEQYVAIIDATSWEYFYDFVFFVEPANIPLKFM